MKEQELPEAGIWEKAAVYSLLWLEKHLEQRLAPIDQERKRPLGRRVKWGLGTVVAGSGAILLAVMFGQAQKPSLVINTLNGFVAQASEEKIPQTYNAVDWQKQPDITHLIQMIKGDEKLALFENNPLNEHFYINPPLVFSQRSNSVILAIEKKTLTNWLTRQILTYETIQLIFTDVSTTSPSMSLNEFEFSLATIWQNKVQGKTEQELLISFSRIISSEVAAPTEFIIKYGSFELMSKGFYPLNIQDLKIVRERSHWYEQQYKSGQLTPFIKVVAVNPLWIKNKLGQ